MHITIRVINGVGQIWIVKVDRHAIVVVIYTRMLLFNLGSRKITMKNIEGQKKLIINPLQGYFQLDGGMSTEMVPDVK